jgi:hypothetical protein
MAWTQLQAASLALALALLHDAVSAAPKSKKSNFVVMLADVCSCLCMLLLHSPALAPRFMNCAK